MRRFELVEQLTKKKTDHEADTTEVRTLDAGSLLRVDLPPSIILFTERCECRMVEAGLLFFPADVFLFRRCRHIADAEGDSGVAEAGRGFEKQVPIMKHISASIIVLAGAVIILGASHQLTNMDNLMFVVIVGSAICAAGLFGWFVSSKEK